MSFPPTPTAGSWRPHGARVLPAPSAGFAAPLPALRHLLAPNGAPGTEGCQTVLDAREEVRHSYTVASEKRFWKLSGYTSVRSAQAPRLLASWSPGVSRPHLSYRGWRRERGGEHRSAVPEFTARSRGGGRVANITSSPCLIWHL